MLGALFVGLSNYYTVNSFSYARKAIDHVAKRINDGETEGVTNELFGFALTILGLALLSGLFLFLTRQTIIVMSRYIEYDLKNEIFRHYQSLDASFYKRNNTGDLMNRISEDVSRVRMYIGPAVMYVINTSFRFILTIAVMLNVNATLTLYVLLPMPVLALSIYYISSVISNKSTVIQQQLSNITTFTQEAFSGIRVMKSYGRETDSYNKFISQNNEYKKRNIDLVKVEAMFHPTMVLLVGLSNLLIVYFGGLLAIEGKISYGNIVEFILYVNALTWPIASLGWVTSLIQRAAASQERINEFFNTTSGISIDLESGMTENKVVKNVMGDIRFENVSFTYPDTGIRALKNISFDIPNGKSIAIIGRTGSGKSTLINLISRAYDVDEGAIYVNGNNIKKVNLPAYRSEIGVVPQEVFLFSDSISNNIGFTINEDNSDREMRIIEAAKLAAIYDNVQSFPNKFETVLGERGVTLSGGQKQRISIARALAMQPKLLLLDDCLSAVDTETEEEILNALQQGSEKSKRTTVIVSHRISSVKSADNIIVLDHGEIVEQGNHDTLMGKKGAYFNLFEEQQLEAETL